MNLFFQLFLGITLLLGLKTRAQDSYQFIGFVQPSNQKLIIFKLDFTVGNNGKISGTSYTDFYGTDNTTSKIEGTWNEKEKTLSFKELENIATKSNSPQEEFCFIRAENLRIKKTKVGYELKGKFEAVYPNGEMCTRGKIKMISAEILEKAKEKLETIENNKLNKAPTLVNGSREKIKVKEGQVRLILWDSFSSDNDRIAVKLNDKWLEPNLVINSEKHMITFNFKPGQTLKIVALDEGEIPPNTIQMMLVYGSKSEVFKMKLKTKEAIYFDLE